MEKYLLASLHGGKWWRSWLRHRATSREVAGSIPDDVIGILHWHNPSGCTVVLGSTRPLTKMITRNISLGRGGGGEGDLGVGLTTLPPLCALYFPIWDLQPRGILMVCPGLYRDSVPLPLPSLHGDGLIRERVTIEKSWVRLQTQHERGGWQVDGDMHFIRELVALSSFCDMSLRESAKETDTSTCWPMYNPY